MNTEELEKAARELLMSLSGMRVRGSEAAMQRYCRAFDELARVLKIETGPDLIRVVR